MKFSTGAGIYEADFNNDLFRTAAPSPLPAVAPLVYPFPVKFERKRTITLFSSHGKHQNQGKLINSMKLCSSRLNEHAI